MNKKEFIRLSERMVKEYYNRYVAIYDDKKINMSDIFMLGFCKTESGMRVLIRTKTHDTCTYEVTYDKETDEIHSFIFEK